MKAKGGGKKGPSLRVRAALTDGARVWGRRAQHRGLDRHGLGDQ